MEKIERTNRITKHKSTHPPTQASMKRFCLDKNDESAIMIAAEGGFSFPFIGAAAESSIEALK